MTAPQEVPAIDFDVEEEPALRTLTVSLVGDGSGSVISEPAGIDCGFACGATFAWGTEVTLFAVSAPGSSFAGWTGAGCQGSDPCVVGLDRSQVVNAMFVLDQAGSAQDPISPLCGQPGVICGSPAGDLLVGTSGPDVIIGGPGNDVCLGMGGDDVIFCGAGRDRIVGGKGDDRLRSISGRDTILGGAGHDILIGGPGQDVLRGGGGNDVLRGDGGTDRLLGGPGTDRCRGGAGRDRLRRCER